VQPSRLVIDAHNARLAAAEQRAADRAEADRAARERSREAQKQERKCRALDAKQAEILRGNPGATAFDCLVGADRSPAMDAADQRTSEWLAGVRGGPIQYHSMNTED
jgi:hypothetical protein